MLSLATATLIPVFFVLFLGYFAGIRRIVDNQQVRSLNLLVMRFALPCALFLATARTPRGELAGEIKLLAVLAGSMWAVYASYYWTLRRAMKLGSGECAVLSLTVALPNYAAVGLPLIIGVLGPKSAVDVAIAIAAGAVLLSPITLMILAAHQPHAPSGSARSPLFSTAMHVIKNPVVLGPLAGLAWSLCGWGLPTALANALDLIGKATPGAALFLTGLVLSAQKIQFNAPVVVGLVFKSLIQPAVAVALVILLGMHGSPARAAILLTAAPSGFFGIMFGLAHEVRSPSAGSTLTLSSVGAIAGLTAAIVLTAGMQ